MTAVDDAPASGPAPLYPSARPVPARASWRGHRVAVWVVLGPLVVVSALALAASTFVPAPYVWFAPGSARATDPAIMVPDGEGFDDRGALLFLTVSVRGASDRSRLTYAQAAWGWVRGDIDVFPRRVILGDQTGAQNRQQNLAQMADSQQVAAKVALEQLGYTVPASGRGAVVASVGADVPAARVLRPGDVIVEIEGREVRLDSELREVISGLRPGATVRMKVERAGQGPAEAVRTRLVPRPGAPDEPMLGIGAATRDLRYRLPIAVTINTDDVGGPSAGLALTLGVLDELTSGSLTGGETVAVTGEMDPEGNVGEVGGVAQKAVAARRAGAVLMLVPAPEAAEARAHAGPDMEIVAVSTLDDALSALDSIGGNALRLGKPGVGDN